MECCDSNSHDTGTDGESERGGCDATCTTCCRVTVFVRHDLSPSTVPVTVERMTVVSDRVDTARRFDLPLRPPRFLF